MKYNKKLLAGVIAACIAPAAHAEIELGQGISVTGFLDMSSAWIDPDNSPSFRSSGIDQFETDFLYKGSSGVSAEVDIEYGESSAGGPGDDDTFVEQAFVTKSFNDKLSLKFGRFLSYTGWETEEPTGLFQYSGAGYAPYFYGYYQQGVSMYYEGGTVDFMASVVDSAFDPLDRETDPDVELGVAISPGEGNFTTKIFYTDQDDADFTNVWASYKVGPMTLAAEYYKRDFGAGSDGDGDAYLLMANYAKGNFGFTVRYHDYEITDALGAATVENNGLTLSPSFKVGDNLLIVTEYRMDDFAGTDVNTAAVEALFMF